MLMAPKKPTPWSKALRKLRESHELTQEEAAAKLGVSAAAWIAWENSQRTPAPMTQRIIRLTFPDDEFPSN